MRRPEIGEYVVMVEPVTETGRKWSIADIIEVGEETERELARRIDEIIAKTQVRFPRRGVIVAEVVDSIDAETVRARVVK